MRRISSALRAPSKGPIRTLCQVAPLTVQKVTVNVRMRCDSEDFLRILHGMETGVPLMLVDDLNIIRPRVTRRTSSSPTQTPGELDIRFNVSGYLK